MSNQNLIINTPVSEENSNELKISDKYTNYYKALTYFLHDEDHRMPPETNTIIWFLLSRDFEFG